MEVLHSRGHAQQGRTIALMYSPGTEAYGLAERYMSLTRESKEIILCTNTKKEKSRKNEK